MKIIEKQDYYEKANLIFISMFINYFHIFYFLKNDFNIQVIRRFL